MKQVAGIIRLLCRIGIAGAATALLASLFLIAYSVVMRYFLNQPAVWVDELVGYLLVACVMLAAGDALIEGEHIAVDILTERLSPRGKRFAMLTGIVAAAMSALLLAVEGIDMVAFSRMVGLISNGYLATPMWMPQLLVPIGAVLMVIAAALAFIETLQGKEPPSSVDPAQPPATIE